LLTRAAFGALATKRAHVWAVVESQAGPDIFQHPPTCTRSYDLLAWTIPALPPQLTFFISRFSLLPATRKLIVPKQKQKQTKTNRYAPCMRADTKIFAALAKQREAEFGTLGCCEVSVRHQPHV
jgi:hypothetical protein